MTIPRLFSIKFALKNYIYRYMDIPRIFSCGLIAQNIRIKIIRREETGIYLYILHQDVHSFFFVEKNHHGGERKKTPNTHICVAVWKNYGTRDPHMDTFDRAWHCQT